MLWGEECMREVSGAMFCLDHGAGHRNMHIVKVHQPCTNTKKNVNLSYGKFTQAWGPVPFLWPPPKHSFPRTCGHSWVTFNFLLRTTLPMTPHPHRGPQSAPSHETLLLVSWRSFPLHYLLQTDSYLCLLSDPLYRSMFYETESVLFSARLPLRVIFHIH